MLNFLRLTAILLISFTLQAQVNPVIVPSGTVFCTGASITFSASGPGSPVSFTWGVVPSLGVSLEPGPNSRNIGLSFSQPLNCTVYLTAMEDGGTPVTTSMRISVARSAKASFNARLNSVGFPNQLELTNYSTGSLNSYWVFDNNYSEKDSSVNTVKYYSKGGTYSVALIANGNKGCNDTSYYSFSISDSSSLVLPNIFSPNSDGANDIYRPITRGISALSAWIYSREGLLISRWDTPSGFWDGRNIAGEACPAGQYAVLVEAWGFDNRSYKLKGMVTLIR